MAAQIITKEDLDEFRVKLPEDFKSLLGQKHAQDITGRPAELAC